MILLAYDGSADADEAIDQTALLFPGGEVTVLTVWEPFMEMLTRSGAMSVGAGFSGTYEDERAADDASEHRALLTATHGSDRADAAGLTAAPRAAPGEAGPARAIIAAADSLHASAIVLGTRGRGGVRSLLMGSVSHDVTQHAERAVLIVPSRHLVGQRRGVADALAPA